MMKKMLLILPLLLLLTGCSYNQGLSQSELFEKKQECFNYEKSVQDKIDKTTLDWKESGTSYVAYIMEIFYSEKGNSCYVVISSRLHNKDVTKATRQREIIDILTNKSWVYDQEILESMNLYNKDIKELKGE